MHNAPRLPWTQIAPKAYQAMAAVGAAAAASSLGPILMELVKTRVSQLNGCAFCVDMHVRDLRKHGETWQRINSLCTWREVGLYSARERVAFGWAESLARTVEDHSDRDAEFNTLKDQFSDQEIVELTWVIAQIGVWNRMCVGMRAPVPEKEIA